ncbi:MAG: 16S rRNA (cytosine(1402)-N(4))-methyltransferase RsmH [Candidatus Woesebacteria bacterium]|jgi:16S rRNA (cytosine1402-N4)-methyltransferase
MTKNALHRPVLLNEVMTQLDIQPDHFYLDATFGRGGHSREILKKKGKVIAFDCDLEAINYAKKEFLTEIAEKNLILVRENFDQLAATLESVKKQRKIEKIDGILFDFGTSVDQLKSTTRGFSFDHSEAALDMRMDSRLAVKAQDLLRVLPEKQLSKIFLIYGGEREARKIAKAVVESRSKGLNQFDTVGELVELILKIKKEKRKRLHPATKVFQALRIAVNDELSSIQKALDQALKIINNQGKIICISFHEGEDRIVKRLFKQWQRQNLGQMLNKKAILPTAEEIKANPRSRSAKMRVFRRA